MSILNALMKGPLPQLYFCIGSPVVGNPTQHMVEQAFSSMGYNGRYLTFDVPQVELEASLWGLRALQFAGGNVTAPYKQSVFPFLDELSESAQLSSAVNCITRNADGRYVGDNTDGKGFMHDLATLVDDLPSRKVLLFGSGGAASAIAAELVLAQSKSLVLINRSEDRAIALAKRLSGISKTEIQTERFEGPYSIEEDNLIVIQATSVGLFNKEACIDVVFSTSGRNTVACDVVFNPVQTEFLSRAQMSGCKTLDGLGMLVSQGYIALQGWTGESPDRTVMRNALIEAFSL